MRVRRIDKALVVVDIGVAGTRLLFDPFDPALEQGDG